ncbi:MAG: hypothetical protein AB1758_34895, partial [Candidatus Eremiobacterota bacterium]
MRDKLDAARLGSLTKQGIPTGQAERLVAAQRQLETVQARQASLVKQRERLAKRTGSLGRQLEEARAAARLPLPAGEEADLQRAMEARAAAQERVKRILAQLEVLREEQRNLEIAVRDNEQALQAAQSEVNGALAAMENPKAAQSTLSAPGDLLARVAAAEAEVLELESELAALDPERVTNAQAGGIRPPDPIVSSIPIEDES